jgi:hypothetical protein
MKWQADQVAKHMDGKELAVFEIDTVNGPRKSMLGSMETARVKRQQGLEASMENDGSAFAVISCTRRLGD